MHGVVSQAMSAECVQPNWSYHVKSHLYGESGETSFQKISLINMLINGRAAGFRRRDSDFRLQTEEVALTLRG